MNYSDRTDGPLATVITSRLFVFHFIWIVSCVQMSVDHTSNGRRIKDTDMTLVYNIFDAHFRLSPPYPS